MCVRFFVDDEDREIGAYLEAAAASRLLAEYEESSGRSAEMKGEIRPSDAACVLACNRLGETKAFPMRWGYYIRDGSKEKMLCVNARSETAAEKEFFSDGWRFRRCIVPSSHYFEWQHYTDEQGKSRTGQKYAIKNENERITWLCGIYRINGVFPEFVVLTRPASGSVSGIHDRMPLILSKESLSEWMRPDGDPSGAVSRALTDLAMEPADDP